jgi:hypothetical protein
MRPRPTRRSAQRSRRQRLAHPHWRGPAHKRASLKISTRTATPAVCAALNAKATSSTGYYPSKMALRPTIWMDHFKGV